jgi:hypothetical protein
MKVRDLPHAVTALPMGIEPLLPAEQVTGRASHPVWMYLRREKYLIPA